MTAHPQSRPLAGPMAPPPMAPQQVTSPPLAPRPVAVGPTPFVSVHPTTRTTGPSHTARAALAVSVLVAVSGVSFALGRLSVDGDSTGRAAAPFAAAAFPAAVEGSAREVRVTSDSPTSGTPSGPDRSVSAAAATATDESDEDAATDVEATDVEATELAASGPGTEAAAGDGRAQLGGGAPDGPPGPAGGRGGLQGTVTEVTDAAITLALADGSTQTVAIDATTAWVQQQPITPADVSPGTTVSVQLPSGGFGGTDGGSGSAATQVTVTAPAS